MERNLTAQVEIFYGHTNSVYSAKISPSGQIIASASGDKTVKLWNLDGRLLYTLQGHSDSVFDVSFSPDGKTIGSAGFDNNVILWNVDLNDLLGRGCNWVSDYLNANRQIRGDLYCLNQNLQN